MNTILNGSVARMTHVWETMHDSTCTCMSTGSFNGFNNDEIYGTTAVKDIPNNKDDQLITVSHLTSTPRSSSTSNIFQSTAIHVSTQTDPPSVSTAASQTGEPLHKFQNSHQEIKSLQQAQSDISKRIKDDAIEIQNLRQTHAQLVSIQ